MTHANSPLTPEGRRRLCERIDTGRPVAHVAAEGGVSRQALSGWYKRWLLYGEAGLMDRSSRPDSNPRATPEFYAVIGRLLDDPAAEEWDARVVRRLRRLRDRRRRARSQGFRSVG